MSLHLGPLITFNIIKMKSRMMNMRILISTYLELYKKKGSKYC